MSQGSVKFPRVSVEGGPRERGRQYGEATREMVRRSMDIYEDVFAYYTGGWTWERICEHAMAFAEPIERYDPRYLEEIRGLGEGAGIGEADALAINVRTEVIHAARTRDLAHGELKPLPPQCSAFVLTGGRSADGHTLAGMNWDWIAETAETGLLLEARQDEGPSFVSLTEAGLLAKVGMNSAGIGLVANSVLTELDRGRPSVPLQVLLRAVFDCETVPQVLTALQRAERSASCNYMIAHEDGLAIDVEGSAGDYSQIWLGYPRDGVMLHTNHFVNPGFDGRDVSVYAMPSSPTRLQRLHQLVDARADEPLEARFFMEALGDHAMYPHSVCSHEDPRQAEEPRSATLASMILDVSARKMWFAPGSPCSTPFEEIDYSELLHSSSPG